MGAPAAQHPKSKIIFISHVNEEVEIAKAIKGELEQHFRDKVKVFLSETIAFGDDWQKSINEKLKEAHLILVVFSPESVERPWINIEAGYGIIQGTKVIPIYCFGLEQDRLHYVYQRLMAIEINNPADIRKLLKENILHELLESKVSDEIIDTWVESWKANVITATTSYSNQRVIRIKLPFQSYFHICNEFCNRCLDVFSWNKTEKVPIIGYALHGGNNQLWQLQKTDEIYFRITSKHSKMCLGVNPESTGDGTMLQQYKFDGDDSQLWDFTQISNDNYKIASKRFSDLCVTIGENDKDPNTSRILLSTWAHKWEQRWSFRITATVIPV